MNAHGDNPMSVGDIAAACGLSVRTLHRAFIREFQTSPVQFLKRRRLERIRADLLAAAPGTTVTRAAFERGIAHLGRFAREYFAAFGESPSDTLRRAGAARLDRPVAPASTGGLPRLRASNLAVASALLCLLVPVQARAAGSDARGGQATDIAPAKAGAFDETLSLLGITFHVTCANHTARPTLTVAPTGLSIDNSPIVREIEGRVIGAEIADLNVDRSPEIYVYVQGPETPARASLVAYSANRRKSLGEIYLAPITDDRIASKGYRGGDDLAVIEGRLVRRFLIYRDGDPADSPTGGTRQIHYKLAPGEAGWVLKTDRAYDF
jgi:AraC-like DNA-binding protein